MLLERYYFGFFEQIGVKNLSIDDLLEHVFPLVEQSINDFSAQAKDTLEKAIGSAYRPDDRTDFETTLTSFKEQAPRLPKLIMLTLQKELAELSGDNVDALSSVYAVNMTLDDLKLLDNDDLEEHILLELMANKFMTHVAVDLNLLTQRLSHIFEIDDIDERLIPLSPYPYVKNFGKACKVIDAPIAQRLLILSLFEQSALIQLKDILESANDYLISLGILVDAGSAKKIVQRSTQSATVESVPEVSANASSMSPDNINFHETLEIPPGAKQGVKQSNKHDNKFDQTIQTKADARNIENRLDDIEQAISEVNAHTEGLSGVESKILDASLSGEFKSLASVRRNYIPDISDKVVKKIYHMIHDDGGYEILQKMLADSKEGPETRISSSGLVDDQFSEKNEVADQELIKILSDLQSKNVNAKDIPILKGAYKKNSIAEDIKDTLHEKSFQLGSESTLSKGDSDLMNLVDMLFNFILSNDYLSDSVKLVISDLQAPIAKVALLDQTFFSDSQHPARQLLNELSKTGMSLSKETDMSTDKTAKNISGTIKKINEDFTTETSVFEQALEEFSEETEKQLKRTELLEQRLIDAEEGRAKYKYCESLVEELYESFENKVPMSEPVAEFLDTAWRDVLVMTCLKFGGDSKHWAADKKVTNKFLNSILVAKKVRLDEKRMKPPVPLLNLLKKALIRISYDSLEGKRLLNGLVKEYRNIANTPVEEVREELLMLDDGSVNETVTMPTIHLNDESELAEEEPGVLEEEESLSEPENPYIKGNKWYDMVLTLPIGTWINLKQDENNEPLRCKLVANIKSLEILVFANKSGIKVAEKRIEVLAEELEKDDSKIVNENLIFDQALENVIVNLRTSEA